MGLAGVEVALKHLAGICQPARLFDEIEDVNGHYCRLRGSSSHEAHGAVLEADGIDYLGEICARIAHVHRAGNQVHEYIVTESLSRLLVQVVLMYNSGMGNAVIASTEAERVECRKCRRPLRSAASRAAGIGPRCAAVEAATQGLNGKQRDKALELIADGGIAPTSRKGVYRVTSTDGSATYVTSVTGHCTCAYGCRRSSALAKTCYHVAAVKLIAKPVRRATRRQFAKAA